MSQKEAPRRKISCFEYDKRLYVKSEYPTLKKKKKNSNSKKIKRPHTKKYVAYKHSILYIKIHQIDTSCTNIRKYTFYINGHKSALITIQS